MKKIPALLLTGMCVVITGCAPQNSPSMMNTSLPSLEESMNMQQLPVKQVTGAYLHKVSQDYQRYGAGPVQLTVVYNPKSKSYRKMEAFGDLAEFKQALSKMNVRNVVGEVLEGPDMEPVLMVSYESITARAPAGCRNMPGFDNGMTTRDVGDYRFGCTTDTMLARQIYRPADLAGNDGADDIDGRRAANSVEYDRQVTVQEAEGELRTYTRGDIEQ